MRIAIAKLVLERSGYLVLKKDEVAVDVWTQSDVRVAATIYGLDLTSEQQKQVLQYLQASMPTWNQEKYDCIIKEIFALKAPLHSEGDRIHGEMEQEVGSDMGTCSREGASTIMD